MNTGNIKIGYVLKVFPRFSQTFVVNEILAHEEAGLPLEIFSLRLSDDTRFHEAISRVTSPVTHVLKPRGKVEDFRQQLVHCGQRFPNLFGVMSDNPTVAASDLQQAMALAILVQDRAIDHLHAHFGTIATTVGRIAARLAGVSYSFTAHAKDIFHECVVRDELESKLMDAANVVTVSNYNVKYLTSEFPRAVSRIVHIDNGLDLDRFTFDSSTERAPVVLGIGRLVEKKGFEYLVRAFKTVSEQMPDARCEIVGGGVLENELQGLIAELGLEHCVQLLGPQPQEEVRRRMRRASVIAAPCVVASDGDKDGLPTVLLEAMAIGTPVVSTDVTGIPEILTHEETGIAVPQRDPRALASACLRLLGDQQLRWRLAGQARKVIEDRFDIHKNSVRLRALFAGIVVGRKGLLAHKVQEAPRLVHGKSG
ncbi:MAG TPA: glycosyltransferase [Xanthomonadales bacterium]|nr:glycosyltransferase [Xanthomonadales bacterium]